MTTLAQQWLEQGRQEGRQEGWQKGRQEGWQKGRQEGRQEGQQVAMRQSIMELLDVRLQITSPQFRARLDTVDDIETLRQLLRRAATVDSEAEFEQALTTLTEKG